MVYNLYKDFILFSHIIYEWILNKYNMDILYFLFSI